MERARCTGHGWNSLVSLVEKRPQDVRGTPVGGWRDVAVDGVSREGVDWDGFLKYFQRFEACPARAKTTGAWAALPPFLLILFWFGSCLAKLPLLLIEVCTSAFLPCCLLYW